METKQICKKIGAVVASAGFIGATLLGAVAQDLGSYPSPFVKNGNFDGLIVVGEKASTEDVLGAIDIGSSLQFSLKQATNIQNSNSGPVVTTDAFKIQKSGSRLNYGDSFNDVLSGTGITEQDLPSILSDGKYSESEGDNKNVIEYTQKITFGSDNGKLLFTQDDDAAKNASDYLEINKQDNLYTYQLEFDNAVKYNPSEVSDDFKTSTINIQGKTYTITDVSVDSGGKVTSLSFLSGEAVLWLTQNNPIVKSIDGIDHTIEVLDVTEDEDACQVKVDGTTSIIDEDATKTINGIQIGITDVRAIHAQLQDSDICQVTFGATELKLEHNQEVKVDDSDIDGTNVLIDSTSGELNGFSVEFAPKELDDNLYLSKNQAYTDPVFTSWKVLYAGNDEDYSKSSLEVNGNKRADFEFTNNDNKDVEIPFYRENLNIYLGDGSDPDERVYADGLSSNITTDVCTGVSSVEDCEGMRVLATSPSGEAHVFEITNIDSGDNTTDIEDLTYGRAFNSVDFIPNTNSSMDLGTFGNNMKLNINPTLKTVTVIDSIMGKIETIEENSIDIDTTNATKPLIRFSELNKNGNAVVPDELGASEVVISLEKSTSDDINVRVESITPSVNSVSKSEDSDYQIYMTPVGTKITEDSENHESVIIESPSEEVYGDVFVAPIVAQLSEPSNTQLYTINKIPVGAARLDSEITDIQSNNLIIVGGPCANKVAAQVMGLGPNACGVASTVPKDSAIIKRYAQASGKVSIVVAGWNAIDTKRATRVLANYDNYDLIGNGLIITADSLGEIHVAKAE